MAPCKLSKSLITFFTFTFMVSCNLMISSVASNPNSCYTPTTSDIAIDPSDIDPLQFALNIEHLEADFFLIGAIGKGLEDFAPELVMGGPPPVGAIKANLDDLTKDIILEFGYEEIGHLRAIKTTVGGFPRPLMDLSPQNFAKLFDEAFGFSLNPPFNPYTSSVNYMLASYIIPYMAIVGYSRGASASIRLPVAEFTTRLSELRNRLANCGIKDKGIIVPPELGAENQTSVNMLSADYNSLSYARTPAEILRVFHGTGDEHIPGGFCPNGANGANGEIAKSYLSEKPSHLAFKLVI
ncbi:hypothetical protein Sjap_006830 [Stephania japonica]|uniref:Desiccation-related protein PCC13-62 n=1 Tax=Stephania japonica TaxID=461633 RepID=A0AAP0K8Z4_9MAGN